MCLEHTVGPRGFDVLDLLAGLVTEHIVLGGDPLALLGSLAALILAWYARRWDWRLLLTAASFSVFAAWIRVDPGGLFEWWID
jgi:hypothetical protein